MKRILIGLLPLLIWAACGKKSSDKKFVVSGKVTNTPAQMLLLEEIPLNSNQRIVVDSARLDKEGNFKLETDKKEAMVYYLRFEGQNIPIASVVNDESKVTLNIKFNKENQQVPEDYEVEGSAASSLLRVYMISFNKKMQETFQIRTQANDLLSKGGNDSLVADLDRQQTQIGLSARQLTDSVLRVSNNPAVSMMVLGYYQSTAGNPQFGLPPIATEEIIKLVDGLAMQYPTHTGVAYVKTMLDGQAKKAAGWVGQTAPEINLPDVNGNPVTLSSFKGKYVLVDFWASWCRPCRADNPNVVRAYQKFKDKNFTILGVSLDRPGEKDEWLKAIKEDNLTWTHISDLQFWSSAVVPLYGIDGIPFNVLVDPQGKIIGQSLHGEALHNKLEEVLK